MEVIDDLHKKSLRSSEKEAGSALYASGSSLNIIFSFTTVIRISFLHLGQNIGNFTRTVSSYTLVRVFPPQIGQ